MGLIVVIGIIVTFVILYKPDEKEDEMATWLPWLKRIGFGFPIAITGVSFWLGEWDEISGLLLTLIYLWCFVLLPFTAIIYLRNKKGIKRNNNSNPPDTQQNFEMGEGVAEKLARIEENRERERNEPNSSLPSKRH